MRADGQTDMTKLIIAVCNFGNDPKIVKFFATGCIHDFMYFLTTKCGNYNRGGVCLLCGTN